MPPGCRIVEEAEGLPPLGQVEIELHRRPGHISDAFAAFCTELEAIVTENNDVAAPTPAQADGDALGPPTADPGA